jgi:hypothetical protein
MTSGYEPIGYCPKCGYRMDAGVCSECGARVDRPLKRDPRAASQRIRRLIAGGTVVAILIAALLGGGRYAAYRWWPFAHLERLADRQGALSTRARNILAWRYFRESARALEHEEQIKTELAKLGEHEWAGSYADGHGTVLLLAPQSGFSKITYTDIGAFRNGDGRIGRISDGAIELEPPMISTGLGALQAKGCELLRVRWGKRHCLVPRGTLECACEGGLDFIDVRLAFLVRAQDKEHPVSGWPELPEEYSDCVVPELECATVTNVEIQNLVSDSKNTGAYRVRATIDKGTNDGAKLGQLWTGLFADLPDAYVQEVSATSAVVEYNDFGADDHRFIAPQVGWLFAIQLDSTKPDR